MLTQILFVILSLFKVGLSSNASINLCALQALDQKIDFFDKITGLNFKWNLCETSTANPCIDKSVAMCLFDKSDSIRVPNAGLKKDLQVVRHESDRFSLDLKGGSPCARNPSKNYTTRIDFYCYGGMGNARIFKIPNSDDCVFNLIWATSFACSNDQINSFAIGDPCVVKVPGFDQELNLKSIRSKKFYSVKTQQPMANSTFQLNFCDTVRNGSCPRGSPLCKVSRNSTMSKITNIIDGKTFSTRSYLDHSTNDIVLRYDSANKSAEIRFICDTNATKPGITFLGIDPNNEGSTIYKFKVKTSNVCVFHPTSCIYKAGGATYDLSGLSTTLIDWSVTSPSQHSIYYLSVCKPVSPASIFHNCSNPQTSVCKVNLKSDQSVSLADFSQTNFSYNPADKSISLLYNSGQNCSADEHYSVLINFRCGETEKGPALLSVNKCNFLFEWVTPEACPRINVTQVGSNCLISDAHGDILDFRQLHSTRKDYTVKSENGDHYDINICGGNQQKCGGNGSEVSVCRQSVDGKQSIQAYTKTEILSDINGQFFMDYTGGLCSQNQPYHTKIIYICDQNAGKGEPTLQLEADCATVFIWKTNLVCPSFTEVDCKAIDKKGLVYDLRPLSKASSNYVLPFSNGKYYINVCRSLVHSSGFECPQNSAACKTWIDPDNSQKLVSENIGEIAKSPEFDKDNEMLSIVYPNGDLCKDPEFNQTVTKIIFTCKRDAIESGPIFAHVIGCTHIFFWESRHACPKSQRQIKTHPCVVKNKKTNHIHDLRGLNTTQNLQVKDPNNNTIFINICAPLSKNDGQISKCGPKSGSCSVSPSGNTTSLGDYSTELTWSENDEMVLTYKNGNQSGGKMTLIRFRCGNLKNETTVTFLEDRLNATFLVVDTALACFHTVNCQAKRANQTTSLFPLMNYHENYNISNGGFTYFLSVCMPLVNDQVKGLNCPSDAAICRASYDKKNGWQNEESLGMPMTSPKFNSNGDVEMTYVNGSICKMDPKKGQKSVLTFKCDPDAGPGTPEIDPTDPGTCTTNITWKTDLVCRTNSSQHAISKECLFEVSNHVVDLKSAPKNKNGSDYILNGKDFIYHLQPCGAIASICNSSLCMKGKTDSERVVTFRYSEQVDVDYDPNDRKFNALYTSDAACVGNKTYSVIITYMCTGETFRDTSDPIVIEQGCRAIILWAGIAFCPKFTKNGTSYGINHLLIHNDTSSLAVGLIFFFGLIILAMFLVFRKPANRDRARRNAESAVERTSQFFGRAFRRRRRSLEETNLLGNRVQAFGTIYDEDDDEMIIA